MTVLLVEQNFRFAAKVADRFYLMDHGVVTENFPTAELPARMAALNEALGYDTMTMIFGIPLQALLGQLLVGLINGSFYAMLSLGLAIIFGLLRIINFAHGAQYMLGAFVGYLLLSWLGIGYWPALILAPLIVGLGGAIIERVALSRLYNLDPLYGLLFTFGLALVIEGTFRYYYGAAGQPYAVPPSLAGGHNLGFMFLPNYRAWVVVASLFVCLGTWLLIEKTKLGAYLRAATENPTLVKAFGINVPLLLTFTYALGAALAGVAGIMAAPIYQVSPLMGSNIIIVVFAVVVVGGMGSILAPSSPAMCWGWRKASPRSSTPRLPASSSSSSWLSSFWFDPPDCSGRRPDMADTALKATATPRDSKAPAVNSLSIIVLGIALVGLLAAPSWSIPSS